MNVLNFPVMPDGLTLQVFVGQGRVQAQKMMAAGLPIARPVPARGIVDTGTDVTAVSASVLAALNLSAGRIVQTHTAGGLILTKLYTISLSIPPADGTSAPLFVLPQLRVTELRHPLPNLEVLVGLDALLQCRFSLDGPGLQFTFSF